MGTFSVRDELRRIEKKRRVVFVAFKLCWIMIWPSCMDMKSDH